MNNYHNRATIFNEIESERENCLDEWKGLGTKVERFTAKLKELGKKKKIRFLTLRRWLMYQITEGDCSSPWI